mgnify:CR=1 FL=1|jgi:hypothetical protein
MNTRHAFAVAVFGLLGCNSTTTSSSPGPICTTDARPSIVAMIRGQADQPLLIGATVTIENSAGLAGTAEGFGDSLSVPVFASNQGGDFDVRVNKPWFGSVFVQGVAVPANLCGVLQAVDVEVVLVLDLEAPPVRQVVLPPSGIRLGDGNVTTQVASYVEASPGTSRVLEWSADSAVVSILQDGTITSRCLQAPDSTWVTAWALVDPTQRDSLRVRVAPSPLGSTRCP